MVKSINQGFLDLVAPLTEKSVYKDSSQEKAWGSDFLSRRIIILPIFALKCFLGELFLQGKEDWFKTEHQLGNPTLGALSYLHVGF